MKLQVPAHFTPPPEGRPLLSADGSTWRSGPTDGDAWFSVCDFQAVTAAGDRVVAVGEGKSVSSLDGGRTWISSQVDEDRKSTLVVATDGNIFVAAGSTGASYLVSASLVDNRTGDGASIPAVRLDD